ncbi:hypothetical protein F5X98DRAFT_70271 [Xylaria grammica]|nr:hypothetical protein F5X98DRAFT_70271 [Xylaria grammica]
MTIILVPVYSRRVIDNRRGLVYSLMGLFGITMPVLYGEGAGRAFNRLQAEIVTEQTASQYSYGAHPQVVGMICSRLDRFLFGVSKGSFRT